VNVLFLRSQWTWTKMGLLLMCVLSATIPFLMHLFSGMLLPPTNINVLLSIYCCSLWIFPYKFICLFLQTMLTSANLQI